MYPADWAASHIRSLILALGVVAALAWISNSPATVFGLAGQKSLLDEFPNQQLLHAPDTDPFTEWFEHHEIDGSGFHQYDAITTLCDRIDWQERLVFECAPIAGGIANVRNLALNCVRFAIEAGAAVVIPPIQERSDSDLTDLFTSHVVGFSLFFDLHHFIHSLANSCPQLKVLPYSGDFEDTLEPETTVRVGPLKASDLGYHQEAGRIQVNAHEWRGAFNGWLEEQTRDKPAEKPAAEEKVEEEAATKEEDAEEEAKEEQSKEEEATEEQSEEEESTELTTSRRLRPRKTSNGVSKNDIVTVVDFTPVMLEFPITADPYAFQAQFGRILRSRPEALRLAAAALHQMGRQFGIKFIGSGSIPDNAYYGAHLRTSSDAAAEGWSGYDVQSARYIGQAAEANLTVMYVASGNVEDTRRIAVDAWEAHGINVTTKRDLLTPPDLAVLDALTWDQQAMVDYEMLLRSSVFGGLCTSSFSWTVACRRHIAVENADSPVTEGDPIFRDRYSTIFGVSERYMPVGLWP